MILDMVDHVDSVFQKRSQAPPSVDLLTAKQILDGSVFAEAAYDKACEDALVGAANYVTNYLTQSDPRLGRSGPICPYVAAALRCDSVTFTLSPLYEMDVAALVAQVVALRANFEGAAKGDVHPATVIVFPYLPVESATHLIAKVQRELKSSFVERGLMIGEFYPGCPAPGVHAPEFRPLDTSLCMLAMRRMALGDVLFTVDSDEQIQSYLSHFGAAGADMLLRLLARNLYTPERRRAILHLLNRNNAGVVNASFIDAEQPVLPALTERLHDRFVTQAAATPYAIALIHRGESWSYRDLDEQSNQLAHVLSNRGVTPGALVGLCIERSTDLVLSLLAVLKTGAAYLPLDPAYPVARQTHALQDSGADFLLSRAALCPVGARGHQRIDLDDLAEAVRKSPRTELVIEPASSDSLACVIYTSGSTGRPKGVMLGHTATAMISWAGAIFGPQEIGRVAATTSVCFDPSIFEIFAPLSLGGTVILKENLLEPFTSAEQPSMLAGVPSAFAELAKAGAIPESVRVINIGGERLSAKLARDIYAASKVAQVWNHYGPTENTICSSVALVERTAQHDPPIGQPIAGARFYVLDDAGQPVAEGQAGELYIGGQQLALGYLNRPDLTAERFSTDPFQPKGRMYRTGDLVRRTANGELLFIGRRDQQVKFRGFRIELNEIEAAIRQLDFAIDAVVIAKGANGTINDLLAVVATEESVNLSELRRALRQHLPQHMLPTKLLLCRALPLTPSGKVDRQALDELPIGPAVAGALTEGLSIFEELVLTVFRDVLDKPQFGPDDHFFDLGGDSIMALAAAIRLEELSGAPVSVPLLYQAPTATLLAPMLRVGTASTVEARPLQLTGEDIPIFCLPDVFGQALNVLSLARHFAGERPVYGLTLPWSGDASVISVAGFTADALAVVTGLQPHGPYILLGYSAGAIPAIDLAHALEAGGAKVTLLLIDPTRPRDPGGGLDRLIRGWDAWRESGLRAIWPALRSTELPPWVPAQSAALTRAMIRAQAEWKPRQFAGATVMVLCRHRWSGHLPNVIFHAIYGAAGSWGRVLRNPIKVITVAVTHHDVMREPYVSTLAAWLKLALPDC